MPKPKPTSRAALLAVIRQVSAMHQGAPAPLKLVALRAGYGGPNTPAFAMAMKRLAKAGLAVLTKTTVLLTEEGTALAGDFGGLPTSNHEAHDKILKELSPKMCIVFSLMKGGEAWSRADLTTHLNYDSDKEAGFKMLLKRIRDKGYLDFVDSDHVQLSDICFPFGRP